MLRVYLLNLVLEPWRDQIPPLEKELQCEIFANSEAVNLSEIERIVRQAEREKMDALLCRWDDYEAVMNCKPLVSVYPVTVKGFDSSVILYRLKKHLEKNNLQHLTKVVLGTNIAISVRMDVLEEMFGFQLYNDGWSDVLPQSYFDNLRAMGYEIVICREEYRQQVERSGMYHFYDPEVYQLIDYSQDLKRTIQQAAEGAQLKTALRDMEIMLKYSFEAICVLDRQGKVTVYNEQAGKLFIPKGKESYSGCDFSEVVPVVDREELGNILSGEESYFSRVVEVNKTMGMLNITPNINGGKPDGAIVHFTSIHKIDQLESQVKSELYIKGHFAKYHFDDIVGISDAILKTKHQAERFAKYNSSVLLCGESGCGKELFAQSIHNSSMRRDQPFVAVNCGSLPTNLLESELFGYVDGAFTGALKKGKKGLFEIANKGTIFLDEITEMDMQGQSRLLRALEEREIMRIGDDKVIPIDVRVIAATNRDLERLVEEGKFREDLYYRLNVLTLLVPPLRQRGRDVVLIAESFLEKFGRRYQKYIILSPEAKECLCRYPWKGNVRQLRNFCERLVILADQKEVSAKLIEEELGAIQYSSQPTPPPPVRQMPAASLTEHLLPPDTSEKEQILLALQQSEGNRIQAAARLGISKATLWRKMKKYEIM